MTTFRRYKLLRGVHSNRIGTDANGKPIYETVEPEQEFETSQDLEASQNIPGIPPRVQLVAEFEREEEKVSAATAIAEPSEEGEEGDGLEEMEVSQLKAMAEDLDLTFHPNTGKAKLIELIRGAARRT